MACLARFAERVPAVGPAPDSSSEGPNHSADAIGRPGETAQIVVRAVAQRDASDESRPSHPS